MTKNREHGSLRELIAGINEIPAVDCHTHIQDDLTDFSDDYSPEKVSGTQAPYNRPTSELLKRAAEKGRLARRTMMDATHALFYSWFAEVAEGAHGRLDRGISLIGANSERERREAGQFMLGELRESRYSEYAEWLRIMFRLYDKEMDDPLDPASFGRLCDSVAARRDDPEFAAGLLRDNMITTYVTSIENRDKIPGDPPVTPSRVDLSYSTHPETWSMFDFNGFLWPERATDFGLFTQGHKFEAEKYLLHLEEYLEASIGSVSQLKEAVRSFFVRVIRSPKSNPTSRVLYIDGFQAEDFRFSAPWSSATVDNVLRNHRDQLEGENRRQVIACVSEAMLEALEEIGREYRQDGARFGACIQLCGGATHFMDWRREVQSIPAPIPRLAQDEYPVWARFPNVHFEYLCAHEGLYRDMANAAKQIGNISVGPWWHTFRRNVLAGLIRDQLSMGPISSIACGFTDARFVEMLVAKYRSLRLAIADALSQLVDDEYSSLHNDVDAALEVARELLFENPAGVHHIPVEGSRMEG